MIPRFNPHWDNIFCWTLMPILPSLAILWKPEWQNGSRIYFWTNPLVQYSRIGMVIAGKVLYICFPLFYGYFTQLDEFLIKSVERDWKLFGSMMCPQLASDLLYFCSFAQVFIHSYFQASWFHSCAFFLFCIRFIWLAEFNWNQSTMTVG